MPALNLFTDAALTTPAAAPLAFVQDAAGVSPPHKRRFYLGSNDEGLRFRAASDPGVDPVLLSIVDTAPDSGQPAPAITLATTEAGLSGATAGAALNLGTQILAGAANCLEIWVQFDDATGVVAVDTSLKLQTSLLQVEAVE